MGKVFFQEKFSQAPNTLVYNKDISLKAKGLYLFIQGKPDEWCFSAERISYETKDGIDSIKSALKELEQSGYLERRKYHDEKGQWVTDYKLLTVVQNGKPQCGNPMVENPLSDIPTKDNPPIYKEVDNNKEYKERNNIPPIDFLFTKIDDPSSFMKNLEGRDKRYFHIAYSFWKLWYDHFPTSFTLKNAKVSSWYSDVERFCKLDKIHLEKLVAIYTYFKNAAMKKPGYDDFWFKNKKSLSFLKNKNRNGEYQIDSVTNRLNEMMLKDESLVREIDNLMNKYEKISQLP